MVAFVTYKTLNQVSLAITKLHDKVLPGVSTFAVTAQQARARDPGKMCPSNMLPPPAHGDGLCNKRPPPKPSTHLQAQNVASGANASPPWRQEKPEKTEKPEKCPDQDRQNPPEEAEHVDQNDQKNATEALVRTEEEKEENGEGDGSATEAPSENENTQKYFDVLGSLLYEYDEEAATSPASGLPESDPYLISLLEVKTEPSRSPSSPLLDFATEKKKKQPGQTRKESSDTSSPRQKDRKRSRSRRRRRGRCTTSSNSRHRKRKHTRSRSRRGRRRRWRTCGQPCATAHAVKTSAMQPELNVETRFVLFIDIIYVFLANLPELCQVVS